jgi:hypothetical protein
MLPVSVPCGTERERGEVVVVPDWQPPYRLYSWDADGEGRGAGGVACDPEDAQRAMVAALNKMAPGARGWLRKAWWDPNTFSPGYTYGETLMTGVRLLHGVRIHPS